MTEGTSYFETIHESPDTTLVRDQLLESLRDEDYRREFVREKVRSSVALQTRALREQRGMTQKELGDAIGMKQTWVSKLENPEYGKMTMETLLRLADAYDTDLDIKFRPFSRLLDELPVQGPEYYSVASFSDEFESPATVGEVSLTVGLAGSVDGFAQRDERPPGPIDVPVDRKPMARASDSAMGTSIQTAERGAKS